MSKYAPLSNYLQDQHVQSTAMSHAQIDGLVHGLPVSASKYRPWWANDRSHSQARAWLDVGWAVDSVDLGRTVIFRRTDSASAPRTTPLVGEQTDTAIGSGADFERSVRVILSSLWGTTLGPARVRLAPGLEKTFDFVSSDQRIVGDAKYYKSLAVPAATWSTIAEYVWLLQFINADRRFLAFGNAIDVPLRWLRRFEPLAGDVEFLFLQGDEIINLRERL